MVNCFALHKKDKNEFIRIILLIPHRMEKPKEASPPKYGVQPDGSVLADPDNDYSLVYFEEVFAKECLKDGPPERTTADK